jgi:hypothetical protein
MRRASLGAIRRLRQITMGDRGERAGPATLSRSVVPAASLDEIGAYLKEER